MSNAPIDVVNDIIAFENGELDETDTVALFQHLIETGLINGLQGSYQRYAQQLVDAGLIEF